MSNAFICTQGTSIANGNNDDLVELGAMLRVLQGKDDPWDSRNLEFEKRLNAKIDHAAGAKLPNLSAELTVLNRKGVSPGDKIVLLCTDVYLGRICGESIRKAAVRAFGLSAGDISIRRVEDLQVHDGVRLSKFGLKNFVETARRAIEDFRSGYTVYLCPNGGYKGVVPFLTLLGMQFRCQVLYTFEFANSIISLPPSPYSFDANLYRRARPALLSLMERGEMTYWEYLDNVRCEEDEREFFLGFVQFTRDNFVAVSPLVEAFVLSSVVTDAMVSKKALADLERERNGNEYLKFCRMILLAQDPIWRQDKIHTFRTSDLLGIKPISSPLRLLGFLQDGKYFVARVLKHAEYEKVLATTNRADFNPDEFVRWEPPEELKEFVDVFTTDGELFDKLSKCQAENKKLAEELNEVQTCVRRLEKEKQSAASILNKVKRDRAAYIRQIKDLEKRLAKFEDGGNAFGKMCVSVNPSAPDQQPKGGLDNGREALCVAQKPSSSEQGLEGPQGKGSEGSCSAINASGEALESRSNQEGSHFVEKSSIFRWISRLFVK